MGKFYCPICKDELEINDIDKAAMNGTSLEMVRLHKQCNHCKGFLCFSPKAKTFKKIPWWGRLFNNNFYPTMEIREKTK